MSSSLNLGIIEQNFHKIVYFMTAVGIHLKRRYGFTKLTIIIMRQFLVTGNILEGIWQILS